MPLEYADYAHHYEEQELTEVQKRAHLEAMSDLLECIVRLFWGDSGERNSLGISFGDGSLQIEGKLDSDRSHIANIFNNVAIEEMAGKQDS